MTVSAVVKADPPSPPSSNSGELLYDLHHLLQQDIHGRYHDQPSQTFGVDEGVHLPSDLPSAYSSPGPVASRPEKRPAFGQAHSFHVSIDQPGAKHENFAQCDYRRSLQHPLDKISLEGESTSADYSQQQQQQQQQQQHEAPDLQRQQSSLYPLPPASVQDYVHYNIQQTQSPPTSNASEYSASAGRSSSCRLIDKLTKPAAAGKSRVQKPIRIRKPVKTAKPAKPNKPNKQHVPVLTAPLSELTKDYDHIPVRDMGAWVNRSTSVRLDEVEKRKGYVTRPMNSFMLYRSAYAERTKIWCLQNNHQVVSSVSGTSWPMEPPEIRECYHEYAKLERDNHAKAHPGYKFSPSKSAATASKKKQKPVEADSDSDGSEPSDLDDFDYDWGSTRTRKNKPRHTKRPGQDASFPSRDIKTEEEANQSSYQATNPGKPLPAVISDGNELYGQYYQTTIHQNPTMANVEDVRVRMTDIPGGMPNESHALTGLPGVWHPELFQPSTGATPAPMDENNVDPFLRAHAGSDAHHPESLYDDAALFQGLGPIQHPHLHYPSSDQGLMVDGMPGYLEAPQFGHNQVLPAWQEEFPEDNFHLATWQTWPDQR